MIVNVITASRYQDSVTLMGVASICGTHADPQGLESQRNTLLEAGALLAGSNAAAARLAAQIAELRI